MNPLDWRFFSWFPAIHLLSGIAYEESRLGVTFIALAPALLLAEAVFLICFFGGYWILRKLNARAYGATGVLVVLVGGSQVIRGLALEAAFVDFLGISQAMDLRRLPGDFTVGFLIALVLAYIQIAQAQFREDSSHLESVRKELVIRRQQAQSAAGKAEAALSERARTALLGKLIEVEKLLAKTDLAQSAEQVRQLVELEVRPLSKEIWNRLEVLAQDERHDQPVAAGLWPKTVPLRRAFRPSLIFLFANLNLIATANALGGAEFALTLLLFSVTMLPIGGLLRRLVPPDFEPKFLAGLLYSLLLTGITLIPTWSYLFSVASLYPGATGLRQSGAGLIIIVVIGLGIRASFVTSQERSLARLLELNNELRRELALIEQSIWIAKRNWSFIVHGTVQGALTVAHSRLKQAEKGNQKVLRLVKADIEKARLALQHGVVQRQSLEAEFRELVDTWDGVCDIKIDCDLSRLSSLDDSSRICIVEVVKEIVGNAFRHGQASQVSFQIELIQNQIWIHALNNGAPVTDSTIGLGTDLLNELTESWSIKNTESGVLVEAVIPFRSA